MSQPLSTRNENIPAFWRWFTEEQAAVMAMEDADSDLWDIVLKRLQSISDHLRFEVSSATDRPRDFVVTAEGRSDLFPLVDEIVAAAPYLPDWRFLSLKPEMGFDFTTRYENLNLNPREMWFLPLESKKNPHRLGLRVGIADLVDRDNKRATNAVLMMLDTGLGERAAAEEIGLVEIAPLPTDPEGDGYIELPELAAFIKWRKTKQIETGRGTP